LNFPDAAGRRRSIHLPFRSRCGNRLVLLFCAPGVGISARQAGVTVMRHRPPAPVPAWRPMRTFRARPPGAA